MKIVLNGEPVDTECHTLQELLDFLEYEKSSVVTAINKEFVPSVERTSIELHSGDLVEIIAPMSGG
ncbi:MAG: sulfur carrier protein ThiS [Granulosicoccus sp.]